MLKANLAKSHSPYYLMCGSAATRSKRGDKAEALRWYEEAFDKSEGPATRLQWGASYVNALVDLAPQDEARIEAAAAAAVRARPRRSPTRSTSAARARCSASATKLQAWNKGGAHAAALARLQRQARHAVRRADAQRERASTCQGLLKAPAKPTA